MSQFLSSQAASRPEAALKQLSDGVLQKSSSKALPLLRQLTMYRMPSRFGPTMLTSTWRAAVCGRERRAAR